MPGSTFALPERESVTPMRAVTAIIVVPCAVPEPADCVHASEVAKPSEGPTGAALVGGGAPCCTSPSSAALAKELASLAVS
jgi:hypothetical protein